MTASAERQALLARVHIAAKELGLQAEAYSDVLTRITGQNSARTLSDGQIKAVLEEFKRLGWKPKPRKPLPSKPNVRMIHGLWQELAPHLADGSDDALRSFVRRQTRSKLHPEGIDAPEFLNGKQANLVIEGLKAWLTRVKASLAAGAPGIVAGRQA